MSYEFTSIHNEDDIPRTPDAWFARANCIYKLLPFEPVFVAHVSVVRDPKSGQMGIDTNDPIRNPEPGKPFGQPEPLGLMRVFFEPHDKEGKYIDGYLLDLRYKDHLVARELNFDNTSYKDEDPNDTYKTVPALGAVFAEESGLEFRCQYDKMLGRYAVSLLEYVDAERRKRGVSVLETKVPKTKSIRPFPQLSNS